MPLSRAVLILTLAAAVAGSASLPLLAQVGNGESAVLVPVEDPRAGAGPAYSDGRLTLYKVPEKDGWMLAGAASPPAECRRETPSP